MKASTAALAIVLAAVAAGGTHAQEGSEAQDLKTIENQLSAAKARARELADTLETLAQEEEAISRRLVELARKSTAEEATIGDSEARLKALAEEEVTIRAGLAEKQEVLSELLAGLQRLERNPPPALVVEPGDILRALRGAIMFGAVVPEMRGEAGKLATKLARLESIRAEIVEGKADRRSHIGKLAAMREDLEQLQVRKKALIAESGRSLAEEKSRAAKLASKARTLRELTVALEAERAAAEARKAKELAAAEVERKRLEELKKRPRVAFADARGRLEYPARGRILNGYGDPDGYGGVVKGLMVATGKSALVTAPADGSVEFAGPFRSYGRLVILNAGQGYHVLLAGLGAISAEPGQFLRAGEPVARMGKTAEGGISTADPADKRGPVLYIEFRKNGEAIDPSPWWIGGAKEARKR